MGEPEGALSAAAGAPRRASASFNDKPLDIGFHHHLPGDRVEPLPAEGTRFETLDMRVRDDENPGADADLSDQFECADRGRDRDEDDVTIDEGDLDRDVVETPHIRFTRMDWKGP